MDLFLQILLTYLYINIIFISFFFQQFPNRILNFGSLCILGEIDPDHVHIPSIYVHKVFQTDQFEKRIERLTLTKPGGSTSDKPDSPAAKMRENIVRRAALEFKVQL